MISDAESYADSSVATGRVSHARQVKCDDPDKKGYPGRPGWELAWGWPTHLIKTLLSLNLNRRLSRTQRCRANGRRI